VKPMLSSPSSGPEDIIGRFGADAQFLCEYKYDGERAQVSAHTHTFTTRSLVWCGTCAHLFSLRATSLGLEDTQGTQDW
jgi:hypothetical protein